MGKESENKTGHFTEELLRVELEIQNYSLERMIREIYENVAQVLSLAKFNLGKGGSQIQGPDQLIGKAIKDLRRITNPVTVQEIAERGFIYSLQHEIDTVNRIGSCYIHLTGGENFYRFDPGEEVILFRMVQESILVLMEYSKEKNIMITTTCQSDTIEVRLTTDSDAGKYLFKNNAAWPVIEKAMSARARLINASISVSGTHSEAITILIKASVTPLTS